MAKRRIQQELEDIIKNPSTNWSAGPINDESLFNWQGAIMGPENTPYEGGVFFINIHFPSDYPFKPFKINFITRIYHPHVGRSGYIHCCDYPELFSVENDPGNWSPVMTVKKGLELIIESLKNIKINCFGINPEVTYMFENNRENFNKIAKEWTQKYAC